MLSKIFRNGNLILEKHLNDAVSLNFSVIISAKIGGGQENFAIIHVNKLASNHAPQFLFDEYKFEFDASNNEIGSLFAFDIDSEENGKVVYSILSGNEAGHFALNSINGDLTIKNVNVNIPSNFTLTVRAADSSKSNPLSTICTVYLSKKINKSDVAPQFKK